VAITRIGNPAIADQRGINFRNIIINGGMDVAQRGTSVSSVTATGYNTCDRFQTSFTGTAGTWTESQSTDVPSSQGFSKSFKLDCTTADASLSTTDSLTIQTKFEGQNLQYLLKGTSSAKNLTLSFWVKSNKTGTYIAELDDNDNARNINKSYTINSADTWEKKTITFAGDTTGAFDNDNGASLRIFFWLAAGTNFTSGTLQTSWGSTVDANRAVGQVNLADSTSNEWYITGVQLEAGQVASDFEFLPFDVNENRCQRYFQEVGGPVTGSVGFANSFTGLFNTTTEVIGNRILPVKMRAAPTVTISALSTFDLEPFDQAPSTLVAQNSSPDEVNLNADSPTARTKGFGGMITIDQSAGYVRMDAEL